jgi:Polysaccharide biosynthesis enzyme WcbI
LVKAIVVSNCATSAYVGGLKAIFPDWEVRGAMSDLAEKWLTEPLNAGFVKYLEECDFLVGVPAEGARYGQLLPEKARRVTVPQFWFYGLQPDCFHLSGFTSVLGAGNLYSRIVVAAFQAGLTTKATSGLFNPMIYEAFGLLSRHEGEEQALVQRFAEYGIDLAGAVKRWSTRGVFLYSYNHPRIDIFTEILRRALVAAGLLPASELERIDVDLGVPDELAESIIWPVYPEIAEPLGLDGSLRWRRGRNQGYQTLDLQQFIEGSFERFSAQPLPQTSELIAWASRLKSFGL